MSLMLEGTYREAVPIHFLFKIESFSLLSKISTVKHESNEFKTGGYKWKLSLYPNGNKNENGNGHISLYLELVDKSLSDCWEFNVLFRLFLFDRIRERYFFRGGNPFHEKKKVWGFPQFVTLAEFNDPVNGYLVDDTCVFGAEVFIAKPPGNTECLSLIKQAITVKHTMKIENFSSIWKHFYLEKFKAGNYDWNLSIYPCGKSHSNNNNVSLYLTLSNCATNCQLKVCTNFKLRLMDQFYGKHIEFSIDRHWFSIFNYSVGLEDFITKDEMNNNEMGYLMNDTCIVEAEVEVLGVVSKRPSVHE